MLACIGTLQARGSASILAGPRDNTMDGTIRANIKPGSRVLIVKKEDQRTGKTTEGIVRDLLTSSPTHPHGIKVRLEGGAVGRVKQILG